MRSCLHRSPSSFNADFSQALAGLRGQAQVDLDDSLLAGVPFGARLALRGDGRVMALQARATAAGNELDVDGRWASEAAQDRWQVKADLPALAALRPLATLSSALPAQRWPQAGAAQLQAQFEGRWPALGGNGTLQSTGVRTRRLHAAGRPAGLAFRGG